MFVNECVYVDMFRYRFKNIIYVILHFEASAGEYVYMGQFVKSETMQDVYH